MQLKVPDVARLLAVDEDRVHRWVREGAIPCNRVPQEPRFDRAELLEWATARGMRVAPEIFVAPEPWSPPRLEAALAEGGIHHDLPGGETASVLRAVVDAMRLPPGVDRELLLQALLAREALGSTAVGDGIAIPHVRNPVVLRVRRPAITLCYLAAGLSMGAPDGRPVEVLFTLVSPNGRAHLHLLARLAAALHDPGFRDAVARRAGPEVLFAAARRLDLAAPADRSAG